MAKKLKDWYDSEYLMNLSEKLKDATSDFDALLFMELTESKITLGQQSQPKRLKNIPSNIHNYKSVPQIEVLKQADVFVTHGGMNSVSEALVQGVPTIWWYLSWQINL